MNHQLMVSLSKKCSGLLRHALEGGGSASAEAERLRKLPRARRRRPALAPDARGYVEWGAFWQAFAERMRGTQTRVYDLMNMYINLDQGKRFSIIFKNSIPTRIRANQGHSGTAAMLIDENLAHTLVTLDSLPNVIVHGTGFKHVGCILRIDSHGRQAKSGLLCGGIRGKISRKHVHCSPFEHGDIRLTAGMREYSTEVMV